MSSDKQKLQTIREAIQAEGERLCEKYPVLRQNNLIGFSIFTVAIAGILLSGYSYLNSVINAWVCIVAVAFLTSLLHELEHDLIHWQYFKNNKFMHHLMMAGVWLFRPGTINPWIRRHVHFLHHKVSGTPEDIEERGIGNGQSYLSIGRWWTMHDTILGNMYRIWRHVEGSKSSRIKRLLISGFPLALITAFIWYSFLLFHGVSFVAESFGYSITWSQGTLETMALFGNMVVVLIAPFYLRSFCINFISSSMHYYGNVDSPLKQTQVLNKWYLAPFQLFCFNFGSTHSIHHFVVGHPFYLRQLTAKAAHRVMKENGVPFNDIKTFMRQNRFPESVAV